MIADFKDVMSQRTDEELIEIVTMNRNDYQQLAVISAEEEIKKRNLDIINYRKIQSELNAQTKKKQLDSVGKVERLLPNYIDVSMGKCISCGIETSNKYSFYAAKYLSSEEYLDQKISQYAILETFHEFACSNCIYPIKDTLYMMGITSVVAGVGFLLGVGAGSVEFLKWLGFGVIMFCSGIYFLYLIGQLFWGVYYHFKLNESVDHEKGGNFVSSFWKDEVNKKYPNCTILVDKINL